MAQFPYLDKFRARVAPPPELNFGTRTWEQVFTELGTALPPDFVAFVDIYGSSFFGNDFLVVLDPRSFVETSYDQAMRNAGDWHRELHGGPGDMPALPEPGGFLSWGSDVDGNKFGWLARGELLDGCDLDENDQPRPHVPRELTCRSICPPRPNRDVPEGRRQHPERNVEV